METQNEKHYAICLGLVLVFIGILIVFIANEFPAEFRTFVLAIGGAILISITGTVLYFAYRAILSIEAHRGKAWRDNIQVAGDNEQVFLRRGTDVEALHLDPRWRHDGIYTEPTPAEMATYAMRFWSPAAKQAIEPDSEWQTEQPRLPRLMDEVLGLERLLIYGVSGTGKTNLLQHIIDNEPGQKVVVDIHGIDWPWPDYAEVYGAGQNFAEVDSALDAMGDEIERRYRLGQGRDGIKPDHSDPVNDPNFPAITLIVDEWTEFVDNSPEPKEAVKRITRILTAGRKIHMFIVMAAHIETVAGTGFAGRMALLKNTPTIRLYKDETTGVYSASLQAGGNAYAVEPPGAFRGYNRTLAPGAPLVIESGPRLSIEESKVLTLWDAGLRKPTPIAREVFGHDGGNQIEAVRDIVEKYRGKRP